MQPDLIRIGKLNKTFGTRGEVLLDLDIPDTILQTGMPVFLGIAETRVPFMITEIFLRPDGRYQLLLDSILSPEQAGSIVNAVAYLERKYLPAPGEGQMYLTELIGYSATDQQEGKLGIIRDILAYPEQDMLEIIDSRERILLLPLVEAYLVEIDDREKVVSLDCPTGLIRLLRGES
jgi:16S rRNA processing protein RimM